MDTEHCTNKQSQNNITEEGRTLHTTFQEYDNFAEKGILIYFWGRRSKIVSVLLIFSLPSIYDNLFIFSSSLWFYISVFCDYLIGSTHPNLIPWYWIGFYYTEPVSYTHLDVYKRQVLDCFFFLFLPIFFCILLLSSLHRRSFSSSHFWVF